MQRLFLYLSRQMSNVALFELNTYGIITNEKYNGVKVLMLGSIDVINCYVVLLPFGGDDNVVLIKKENVNVI